jgi:hypothetical protein
MSEPILSEYFYGDESEEFTYFRIPSLLIKDPKYKHVSTDAKLLYGMYDEFGNPHTVIDPEIKDRIQAKIIDKIIYDFDPQRLPEGETLEDC